MAERQHNFLREGLFAGFLGATAIVVWFLIVDTVTGRPFHTPQLLGGGLVSVLARNMSMAVDSPFAQVASYTVFHYAAFCLVGIVLAAIVHQAERTPGILAGLLVAFVILAMGFYMLAAVFAETPLGQVAWYQIFIANLLAAGLMFGYMWRTHPKLGGELKQALEGTDD